jgi:hypothetical protein
MALFSLVIQGPLRYQSIDNINKYFEIFDEIVISHWSKDTLDISHLMTNPKIKIVKNEESNCKPAYNQSAVYYQTYTTLHGLYASSNDFAIKVRSDYFIGNLRPLMTKILDTGKIVCSNLHFRPNSRTKYHISDPIIGGSTLKMQKGFEKAVYYCENRDIIPGLTLDAPEPIIGTSFVLALLGGINVSNSVKEMKDIFDVVKIEELGDCVGKDGSSVLYQTSPYINNMEEL